MRAPASTSPRRAQRLAFFSRLALFALVSACAACETPSPSQRSTASSSAGVDPRSDPTKPSDAGAITDSADSAPAGYALLWSDEFDEDGPLDATSWSFEEGLVRNEELQLYRRENAFCEGGRLVIEARRETVANPDYRPRARRGDWRRARETAPYTSASVTTRGKQAFTFGRIEARIRFDPRPGMWPAFWTLGDAREWPGGGEVDILEYYRGRVLANIAWGTRRRWTPRWDSEWQTLEDLEREQPGWREAFHRYRMDWDEERIALHVDDRLVNEVALRETVNSDGSNPFLEPHYLLLSFAIGGTNGGDPSATEFPARLEVDYVRVYQRAAREREE